MSRRIAVGIEYDGRAYRGWQIQQRAASVQASLQRALTQLAAQPIELICAGRTDAGVHAREQIAHFDTQALRSERAWILGANTQLPADIALRWARRVPDHFHARYSALDRSYRYVILNRMSRSALSAGRALVVHKRLDEAAMQQGAAALIGEHDFSAFRSSHCQARSPIRRIDRLQISRHGEWVTIDVTANAYLHHMVRNVAGLLIAIGLGRAAPARAHEQLASRSRVEGEPTAAAHGLYLWQVRYAGAFGLPADSAMIDAAWPDWPGE